MGILTGPDDSAIERACRRYAARVNDGTSQCRADGDVKGQVGNYRERMEQEHWRGLLVRRVLADCGVAPVLVIPCLNFARHVGRICRQCDGATRRLQVGAAIARWQAFGLDPVMLRAVSERLTGVATREDAENHKLQITNPKSKVQSPKFGVRRRESV